MAGGLLLKRNDVIIHIISFSLSPVARLFSTSHARLLFPTSQSFPPSHLSETRRHTHTHFYSIGTGFAVSPCGWRRGNSEASRVGLGQGSGVRAQAGVLQTSLQVQ